MTSTMTIQRAGAQDSAEVSVMVGELLVEIMAAIGSRVFNFDCTETTARLEDLLGREKYFVFVARDADGKPAGFVSLCESYALYAEGAFGIIPELFVRPEFRSYGLGRKLVSEAKTFGASRGWRSLEVTTPSLPQFNRTLAYYEGEGFSVAGGRKMKLVL